MRQLHSHHSLSADGLSDQLDRSERPGIGSLNPGLEQPARGSAQLLLSRMQRMLPPELVPHASLAAAREVTRLLSGSMTARLGFEARLRESADQADLLCCVTPWPGEREALLSCAAGFDGSTPPAARAWHQVGSLAREWARPVSRLHRGVSNLWLEFDLDRPHIGAPVPSVFFGLDDPDTRAASFPGRQRQPTRDREATRVGLGALGAGAFAPLLTDRIDRCFRALPADAKIFQVGMMLARRTEAVRLCVRRLPAELFCGYLRDVGWTGDPARLGPCLDELRTHAAHLCLDLDVTKDGIAPRLGIECSASAEPQDGPSWDGLLGFAGRLGLCSARKAEALLRWPGVEAGQDAADELLVRAIAHVKFAYQAGRLAEAKAYFGGWRRVTAASLLRGTV